MKLFTPPKRSIQRIMLITIAAASLNLPAIAGSSEVPISQVINPGALTLVPSDHATLSAVTLSHTSGQTSNGELGQVTVDDSRGAGAGWNVTATVGNFTSYTTFTDTNGQAGPFTVHGTYTGSGDTDFILTTGSGSFGSGLNQMEATLNQSGTSLGNHVLTATQTLGSSGLSFDAPDISYQAWTEYHLRVRVIPASGMTFAPGTLTTLAGDPEKVAPGTSYTVSGPNDPATILSAPLGFGEGLYNAGSVLSLAVPAGTSPGTYHGIIVETIN